MKILVLFFALAISVVALCPANFALAQTAPQLPLLHPMFSDDAILQRDQPVPIWGWTIPGDRVTVHIANQDVAAIGDDSGRWKAQIGPFPAGGSFELTVTGHGQVVTRQNIVFGDVWLCSGQSNMEFQVKRANNAPAEKAAANSPQMRVFRVSRLVAPTPQLVARGSWKPVTPETIGDVSAVGYYFGRKLHQELGVPIGLIDSAWGGTPAEAWVSPQALGTLPDFRQPLENWRNALANPAPYEVQVDQWWKKNDAGREQGWHTPQADDAAWKTMPLPGVWEKAGLPGFHGVVWFRREINVPADWVGQDLTLHLGAIDDRDTTFWNGVEVGSTENSNSPRDYRIAGAQVQAGRNVIAVRVLNTGGDGGFKGPATEMRVERDAATFLPITGDWKYHAATALAQLSEIPINVVNNSRGPTAMFNNMIAPLAPYGIKGIVWYQGESNVGRAEQYRRLLPTLIADWRTHFDAATLPFYIVQLPNYLAPDESPRDDGWPRLRQAQREVAAITPNSGLAVTIDLGEQNDVHPPNKQDVGARLALVALAKTYGRAIEFSGPTLKTFQPEGQTLRLTFDHTAGGLTFKGDAERVFALSGADKKFVWASARIEGNDVVVSAPTVKAPEAVHFAWSNNPRAALYNGAGLPAAPFRTDHE